MTTFTAGQYVWVEPYNEYGMPFPETQGGMAVLVVSDNDVMKVRFVVDGTRAKLVTIRQRNRIRRCTPFGGLPARNSNGLPPLLHPDYVAERERQREYELQLTNQTVEQNTNFENAIDGRQADNDNNNYRYKNITTNQLLALSTKNGGAKFLKETLQDCCHNLDRGFLRLNEAIYNNRPAPKTKSHLSNEERHLVIIVASMCEFAQVDGVKQLLAYAWGISHGAEKNFLSIVKQRENHQYKRKKRSDTGENMLIHNKRRERHITPFNRFAQTYRSWFPGEKLQFTEIQEQWELLEEDEKQLYVQMAEENKQRLATILSDVSRYMKQCRGQITWQQLTSLVSGDDGPRLISADTLRRNIMRLPGSRYRTTTIHPQLMPINKEQRKQWAISFAVFWKSATIIKQNVQVLVLHIDEKWFYSIVVRKNCKQIPLLGVEPAHHYIRNKQNLPKVMGICTVGFLPNDNDLQRGGTAIKVSLDRVGGMFPAQRDAYRQQIIDGRIRYPRDPTQQTRVRGQLYWKPLDITGSREIVRGVPKFSLKKYFDEVWIPRVEQVVRQLSRNANGQNEIKVRMQWDNAGPHKDRVLTRFLESEFKTKGWHFVPQPSNSPITNVLDACVFPALSKIVTREQAINHNSYELRGEQIWNTVLSAWDKLENPAIARSYVCHSQVAAALVEHNGGDEFVREKNALHWGVRKHYVPYYPDGDITSKPVGVTIVTQPGNPLGDEIENPTLRYELPDVQQYFASAEAFKSCLKPSEIVFLYNNFPVDNNLSEIIELAYNMTLQELENSENQNGNESESNNEDEADEDNNHLDNYIYNEAEAEADNLEYECGFQQRNNNYDDDELTDYDEEELQKVDRLFDDFVVDSDDEE